MSGGEVWRSPFGRGIRWVVFVPAISFAAFIAWLMPAGFLLGADPDFGAPGSGLIGKAADIIGILFNPGLWIWGAVLYGNCYLGCRYLLPNVEVGSIIVGTLCGVACAALVLSIWGAIPPGARTVAGLLYGFGSVALLSGCVGAYGQAVHARELKARLALIAEEEAREAEHRRKLLNPEFDWLDRPREGAGRDRSD